MILYTVLCRARDAAVLVECSADGLGGNASQATLALLEHLRDHPGQVPNGERMTLVQRNEGMNDFFSNFFEACTGGVDTTGGLDHFFHVWRKDGVYYCCLSDDAGLREQNVNYAFLEHVEREFTKRYSPRNIDRANAYAMEKSFSPDLRSALHHYNTNHTSLSKDEKVRELSAQVEDLKAVMGRNISLMLKRGDDLDRLVEKSEQMKRDSMVFQKRTAELKRAMWKRNCFWSIFIVGTTISFLYLLAAGICGLNFSRCAFRNNSDGSS